jgi:hypothetical protein
MRGAKWVVAVCASLSGCDAGRTTEPRRLGSLEDMRSQESPGNQPARASRPPFRRSIGRAIPLPAIAPFNGPPPQNELVTAQRPTADEVAKFFGQNYEHRELLKVIAHPPDSYGLVIWNFTYDGVALDQDARTSKDRQRPNAFITRIIPPEHEPPRVRRADLISPKQAVADSELRPDAEVTLLFRSRIINRRPKSDELEPRTVDLYTLEYEILDNEYEAMVDAYTGELTDRSTTGRD